jgi:hypothetical protein
MSHLLHPIKSLNLLRWACFESHRALLNALSLSKTAPALQLHAFERFRHDVHESSRLRIGSCFLMLSLLYGVYNF